MAAVKKTLLNLTGLNSEDAEALLEVTTAQLEKYKQKRVEGEAPSKKEQRLQDEAQAIEKVIQRNINQMLSAPIYLPNEEPVKFPRWKKDPAAMTADELEQFISLKRDKEMEYRRQRNYEGKPCVAEKRLINEIAALEDILIDRVDDPFS